MLAKEMPIKRVEESQGVFGRNKGSSPQMAAVARTGGYRADIAAVPRPAAVRS